MIVRGSVTSRVAAFGLLAITVGIVYLIVVEPLLARSRTYDDAIRELTHRLSQFARIASSRNQIEGQITALRAEMPLDQDLLAGGTEAIAGANLQELLKEIALRHGGSVVSTRPTEPLSAYNLQNIGVEITLNMDIGALQAMLYEIESGRPLLFVDTLRIQSDAVGFTDERPGEWAPVVLGVELVVHGYRRQEAP